LPEFWRGSGKREHLDQAQPTESLLGMAAVNDVNVSSAYANLEAVGEYWALRERLGLIESEFVGHWRPDCPVRALSPEARASLYRGARGAVAVIANRAATEKTVEVRLELQALGLEGGVVARDERRGKPLEVRGDKLAISLGPHSYSYVTLRAR
jgi:Family of unknown function (DUF6067)